MKIFCMIIGFLMIIRPVESRGVWGAMATIAYFVAAGFLIAFPLYLEFYR